MSKYVIEIQYVLLNGKADHKYYTAVHPIAVLEELNSNYINKHYEGLQDEAYQRGLNDAWEAARKIVADTGHGGIALCTLGEIFGTQNYSHIMRDNTAQEAISKLKAYEEKQKADDEIKVENERMKAKRVMHEDCAFLYWTCSNCNSFVLEHDNFCSNCGVDFRQNEEGEEKDNDGN